MIDDDDDLDDETTRPEPYRDGYVHVMADKCSTCVFRPGNLMHLEPGRLQSMAADVQETGIPFSCHQTLPYSSQKYLDHYGGAALCAGAVEAYGDWSPILRLAAAKDVIAYVHPHQEQP